MLENSGISAMQKTTRRKEIEIKRKRHGEGEKEKEMVTSPATPLTSIACRKHKWGTSVEVGEIAVYIFFFWDKTPLPQPTQIQRTTRASSFAAGPYPSQDR